MQWSAPKTFTVIRTKKEVGKIWEKRFRGAENAAGVLDNAGGREVRPLSSDIFPVWDIINPLLKKYRTDAKRGIGHQEIT